MPHDPFNAMADLCAHPAGGSGPLAGVRVGIKCNIAVAGLPHTGGLLHLKDQIAARDARVVTQLRSAGASIIGTTTMHEGALGATTDNAHYGRTHNPHRHGHTPGGSSGGSGAAVAAGLVDLALGTDTLGSIRIPAAYCGVYGLKPTHGAVSDDGLIFLEARLDSIGPLARDLDMIERAWAVIGPDAPPAPDFARLLVLDKMAGVACEPAVTAAYVAALLSIRLPQTVLTLPADPAAIRVAALIAMARALAHDLGPHRASVSDELGFVLDALAPQPEDPGLLLMVRDALVAALGDDGVLLLPTTPQAAFAQGGRAPGNAADFTGLANVAGLPALALPAGWSADGLPVSVQLVGPAGSERRLIALGRRLDRALNQYRPPCGQQGSDA